MKLIWIKLLLAVTCCSALSARTLSLINEAIQLDVLENGTIEIREFQSGTTWRQVIPEAVGKYTIGKLVFDDETIVLELESVPRIQVRWELAESRPDVLVAISASNPDADMPDNIGYPYPFLPPNERAELVIPNRSGALYPVTERVFGPKAWKVGGKELLMSWYGIINETNTSGLITVIQSPHDAEIIFPSAGGFVAPMIQWMPIMGGFGDTRRIVYHFSAEGGYVALAKYYRQYKMDTGPFVTLVEKVARNPQVAKLIGGINARVLHNNEGLSARYLKRLPEYGITKGSLCVRAKDDPGGLITRDIVNLLVDQGFLLTNWCTKKWVITETNSPVHPQFMENPKLLITADGTTFSKNELKGKGDEGSMRLICDTSTTERINQFVERVRKNYPLKPIGFSATGSLKIDTLCGDLYECYDPQHPQTRTQSVQSRIEMLKDLKRRGFVLSAEGGDDWGVPYLDTAYGPLGLQRSQGRKIAAATWGIKYPVDPEIGPQYDEYYFGPTHRIPLFDLVYHDCIITTFHDGDSNNMYYKSRAEDEKYWRLKELFQVLHGQAPNFYLTVDEFFEEQHQRIKKSIETVCQWHAQVAYDELVMHRFLTEDRMVQESQFSSGRCVVVNFDENRSRMTEYGRVEPLDFIIGRWK